MVGCLGYVVVWWSTIIVVGGTVDQIGDGASGGAADSLRAYPTVMYGIRWQDSFLRIFILLKPKASDILLLLTIL